VVVVERNAPLDENAVRRLSCAIAADDTGSAGPEPRRGLPLPAPREAAPLWTAIDHGRTALLVPLAEAALSDATAVAVHDVLRSLAAAPEQVDVSGQTSGGSFAGMGRPAADVGDVPRAYREAQQALGVARRLGGGHRAAYFGSLGVYRLLAAVEPASELSAFCEDVLGPLRAQDQRSGGDLLRTLEAYLLSGGSPQLTAERLHTHRNTILYRLERIQRLLGVDLRQPERQLTLHLALRAAEMLGEARSGPSHGDKSAAVTLQIGR
jgi:DNA-binding PucR family transcriptional regulator